jgi:hypothetical protein
MRAYKFLDEKFGMKRLRKAAEDIGLGGPQCSYLSLASGIVDPSGSVVKDVSVAFSPNG